MKHLLKSQLPGVLVGAIVVLLGTYLLEIQKRVWSEDALAAAFVGEISAILEYQNTKYLRGLRNELEKGKIWDPIDQPAERLFNVYEAAAPNLGLLETEIVERIAKFYWLKNEERGKKRILGGGTQGYMKFELSDKKVFLDRYIQLNERLKKTDRKSSARCAPSTISGTSRQPIWTLYRLLKRINGKSMGSDSIYFCP